MLMLRQRLLGVRGIRVNVRQATNVFVTRGSVMATMTAAITRMKTAPSAVSAISVLTVFYIRNTLTQHRLKSMFSMYKYVNEPPPIISDIDSKRCMNVNNDIHSAQGSKAE